MTADLRWYASRLQAMSIAEIGHRSYRAARYPIEQLRMRTGRYARLSAAMRAHVERWRGPEPFYVDRERCGAPVAPELLAEAEAICAGKRRALGLGWIDVPLDHAHYEPAARACWPRVDAARVVRAAPAHFDPRLTWELNRGHDWVVLARVHAATRQPRFLDELVGGLARWRRENPIGVGINWVSAMEAAIRVHSLVWCAGFVRGTEGILPALGETICEHALFVADHLSTFSSANNHLLVELSALIVAALALGGDLARFHRSALARLTSELARQIHDDGVSREMATHYHVFALEALVLVATLQRAHGAPARALEATVRRMADYLDAIRCRDGRLLQQGDSDDGCILGLLRADHAQRVLAAADALRVPGGDGSVWLGSVPAEERPARSRRFESSGQIVLRCRRLHAAFDAGAFGFGTLAAHAHCDALSIALAIDGRRLLVDRGTFRYNGDRQARDAYRLTAAHNTVQLGALEQASPAGAFLWSRRPEVVIHRCELDEQGAIVQASHDGFAGWVHLRTLVHHAHVLVIVDEFRGAGRRERIVSRLHVAPELEVVRESASSLRACCGTSPLVWIASGADDARVTRTQHSDEYAQSTPAPTIELEGTSDRTLLVALGPADIPLRAGLAAVARFAAERGVQLSTRACAK